MRAALAPGSAAEDGRAAAAATVAVPYPEVDEETPGRLARWGDQLSDKELRKALIAHVRSEAERYPGRARRGLPDG